MTRQRVGLWLVGAFGGVGTTITLGLAAMARGLADRTGLVTELPLFRRLAAAGARRFRRRRPRYPPDVVRRIGRGIPAQLRRLRGRAGSTAAATSWPRPRRGFGRAPASARAARLPAWVTGATRSRRGRRSQAVDRIAADMAAFVDAESIDHMIVLNVASTEPPFRPGRRPPALGRLNAALADGGPELLPASSLYALAALRGGYTYINFTPSLGASIPALDELAAVDRRRSMPARTARPARP